jgi:hypothetical protein
MAKIFHRLLKGPSRDSHTPAVAMSETPGPPTDGTIVLTAGFDVLVAG